MNNQTKTDEPKQTKASRRTEKRQRRRQKIEEQWGYLSVMDKLSYIPFKHPPSEFEVQSFIYEQLRVMGYYVRAEVGTRCGSCIFDIVVYVEENPVRVIEVKKNRGKPKNRMSRKNIQKARDAQIDRYGSFGVPVDLVCSMEEAKKYIDNLRSGRKRTHTYLCAQAGNDMMCLCLKCEKARSIPPQHHGVVVDGL